MTDWTRSVPVRRLLVLPTALVVVLSNVAIAAVFFAAALDTVRDGIDHLQAATAAGVTAQLDDYVDSAVALNYANYVLFATGFIGVDDTDRRDQFFSGQLHSHQYAAMSFVGLPDGAFYGARRVVAGTIEVVRNNASTGGASRYYIVRADGTAGDFVVEFPGFDPRTRPWYQAALAAGEAVFSPVYRHFVFNDLAVTASLPYYSADGDLVGIFGVDFLLDRIGEFLQTSRLIDNSVLYIVERESGLLIANSQVAPNFTIPEPGRVVRFSPADQPGPVATSWKRLQQVHSVAPPPQGNAPADSAAGSATAAIVTAPAGSATAASGSGAATGPASAMADGYLIKAVPYRNRTIDWQLVVALPSTPFLSRIYQAAWVVTGVALAAVVAFVLIAMRLVHHLVSPLTALADAARRIGRHDWDVTIDTAGSNEIGVLAKAFATMGDELRTLVRGLETRVHERTAELESANQTKERFISIIAHDLRGPLGAVNAIMEHLVENPDADDAEERATTLRVVAESTQATVNLLENLLLWGNNRQGRITFAPVAVDLHGVLQEAADQLGAWVDRKGLTLRVVAPGTPDAPPAMAMADRDMLLTIIRNLISNAIKFTERGGTIRIGSGPCSEHWELWVEDSGTGMDPGTVERLTRIDVKTSRRGTDGEPGSGLGLVLVADFLRVHGSELHVTSEPGVGSRFSFALPTAVETAAPTADRPAPRG